MDKTDQIPPSRSSLSPTYTQFIHRLLEVYRPGGKNFHPAKLAQEADLAPGHSQTRSEVCRLIHFSTSPTTTVLSISFKIYIDNSNRGCGKVDKSRVIQRKCVVLQILFGLRMIYNLMVLSYPLFVRLGSTIGT